MLNFIFPVNLRFSANCFPFGFLAHWLFRSVVNWFVHMTFPKLASAVGFQYESTLVGGHISYDLSPFKNIELCLCLKVFCPGWSTWAVWKECASAVLDGQERLLPSPRVLQIQLAQCIAEVSCPLLSCRAITFCVMECVKLTFLTVLLKCLCFPVTLWAFLWIVELCS